MARARSSYQGQTIWIIGASSGIGAALALELANRGARLVLSARRRDALAALCAQLEVQKGQGSEHIVLPFDAGDREQFVAAFENLQSKVKRLDSAIYMAVSVQSREKNLQIQQNDQGLNARLSFLEQSTQVNLTGAFLMHALCLQHFLRQGQGQLVFCGSLAGYRGLPLGQPYCATKAALANFAESLRMELHGTGIDVKLISPGFVQTPLTDQNDFKMPFMLSAPRAAQIIADSMQGGGFEIHFPLRLSFAMKLIRFLPQPCYVWLVRKLLRTNMP